MKQKRRSHHRSEVDYRAAARMVPEAFYFPTKGLPDRLARL